MTRVLAPSVNAENVELRADSGESYISISPANAIEAKTPTESILLDGEGNLSAEAATTINLNAPLIIIKGQLTMQSPSGGSTTATLNGALNASGDLTADGISLAGHTHNGVTPGGGSTGGPE